MQFFENRAKLKTPPEFRKAWDAYRDYLSRFKQTSAGLSCGFVFEEWYYDYSDPRSPHDSWIESIAISEKAIHKRADRETSISVTALGAFHDRVLLFQYESVSRYSMENMDTGNGGHGDWLVDEFEFLPGDLIKHHIRFACGGEVEIVARAIKFDFRVL